MNVKSILVGFLIAVVASTGTYFLLPPPSDAEAARCATVNDVDASLYGLHKHIVRIIEGCRFKQGGEYSSSYNPDC